MRRLRLHRADVAGTYIPVSWNDDAIESNAPFVPDLLHAVLGRA
jgi:hypothetical protein